MLTLYVNTAQNCTWLKVSATTEASQTPQLDYGGEWNGREWKETGVRKGNRWKGKEGGRMNLVLQNPNDEQNNMESQIISTAWCLQWSFALNSLTIQLKVRFADSTPDLSMLWLSQLAMRDWMNMSLNFTYQRQKCGQWTVVSEHMRLVQILAGVYCREGDEPEWNR